MKKIYNFFSSLQFIFRPSYWIMLGRYSKSADEKLLRLAAENDFEPVNVFGNQKKCYEVKLGDAYYWVANFPVYFFIEETPKAFIYNVVHMEYKSHLYSSRPSRLTISRLHKKLVADLDKHGLVHA